jgi:hypothetical protein
MWKWVFGDFCVFGLRMPRNAIECPNALKNEVVMCEVVLYAQTIFFGIANHESSGRKNGGPAGTVVMPSKNGGFLA